MGFAEKAQVVDGGFETEGKKWVIAGITTRAPLRQIRTKRIEKEVFDSEEVCDQEESCSTTPTAKEAKIPEKLPCPPAPRKRRSSSRCNFNGVREFFNPPDLESVFIRHVERAK